MFQRGLLLGWGVCCCSSCLETGWSKLQITIQSSNYVQVKFAHVRQKIIPLPSVALTVFLYGKAPPLGPTPCPFTHHICQNRYPFLIRFISKWYSNLLHTFFRTLHLLTAVNAPFFFIPVILRCISCYPIVFLRTRKKILHSVLWFWYLDK